MSRHIQNEDVKSLADLGGDKSKLPSSDKIGMQKLGKDVTLGQAIDDRLLHGQPLLIHQDYPATGFLRIEPSEIASMESIKSVVPIKSQIQSIPASSINFQTGATSGATFDLIFPNGVIGEFTRLGLTLLSNGVIKGIFAPNAATLGALANPGTLFVKGGLPLGYINLQYTSAIPGRFKTPGSIANIVEAQTTSGFQIFIFGSGAGGGSGEGDANSFYEDLKARLLDSTYKWFTSNIVLSDEDTLRDPSSTAIYDIANSVFKFESIGAVFTSIQQFGGAFLELSAEDPVSAWLDAAKTELHADWEVDDPAATYRVSRDGGLNWLTIPMTKVGISKRYVGRGSFPEPVTTEALVQYPTAVAATTVDLTGSVLARAVKLVVTEKSRYSTFRFKYNKTGAPDGSIQFSFVKEVSGAPSTSLADILASTSVQCSSLLTGPNMLDVSLPVILPPGTYWVVMQSDALYQASYSNGVTEVALQADSNGGYSGGDSYQFNGTVWSASTGIQVLFETVGFRYNLLVEITGGTLNSTLKGYGVFFGEDSGVLDTPVDEPQYFRFSGNLDQTDIVVTNFWPNPKTVRVTYINAGLTFIYPFFDIVGNTLKFASGTFLQPGMDIHLKVENVELGSSANLDVSKIMSLLAENSIGSEVPTLDMSIAGKGFKIRRPDGTLRMVRLNDDDEWVVESLP